MANRLRAAGCRRHRLSGQHGGNLVLINPRGELHALLVPPFAHGALR
ncbi:MAG: hypothetical protein IPN63_02845 [Gammaproteobacteria bacterium]|nr:hypothetical protein [Gammaproteobacteria bacterium]